MNEVEGDLESYKKSVTGHFNKTSELVNELTEDYIKVYKHLASGAQSLGDAREIVDLLEENQSKILISFTDEIDSPPEAKDQDGQIEPAEDTDGSETSSEVTTATS